MNRPRIAVVGSANADMTVTTPRLPSPGETVLGGRLGRAPGGKGANQALAAARAGARVSFLGRVGRDDFGRGTVQSLANAGVDTDGISVDNDAPTGVALIMVDENGENMISVASGANARLGPEHVRAARDTIGAADMMVTQLEIPLETVLAAAQAAREAGVPVLLNPAPAPGPDALDGLLSLVDYLVPNAGEAAALLGADEDAEPPKLAARLAERAGCTVILTLGRDGACVCDEQSCTTVPAPQVHAVDTVGAGDCFCATLAVALAEGRDLQSATRFATCAAALAVQGRGAQPSMPHREDINRFMTNNSAQG